MRTRGKTIGQIARELDLIDSSVRLWVEQADEHAADSAVEADVNLARENAALRKKVRELEMEKSILKKASALFAREFT